MSNRVHSIDVASVGCGRSVHHEFAPIKRRGDGAMEWISGLYVR